MQIKLCSKLLVNKEILLKLFLAMKLTVFLVTIICLQVGAKGFSQNISLSGKNLMLEEVFSTIEKQSGYYFFYKYKDIKDAKTASINIKEATVDQALRQSLNGLPFSYSINNKTIVITKKPVTMAQVNSDTTLTIRGRVFDTYEPPGPLPGIGVTIKGTTSGTTTDGDGYFSIKAKKGDVLVFSMISFKKLERVVTKSEQNLTISLENDVAALEQVVVTGMTEQKVKHIASSIATLDIKSNIEGKPITSLSQALQGGVTGIDVRQGSGLPGGDAAAIKIRGISTINNSDALILVDGVPMDMNYLDPVTIESVTVLKDAAAAAMYGARAANGVILVTTKRGTPGRVSVVYDSYAGLQSPSKYPDFVDAPTYMKMYNVAMVNSGGQPFYTDQDIAMTASGEDPINYPNTDWADIVLSKYSPITSHSLSVSGGNELARFAITGNYLYQDGMIPVNNADKYTLRANTSVSLSKKFLMYLDVLAIKRNTLYPNRTLQNGGNRILDDMYRLPPTVLPKYPEVEGKPAIYGRYADIVNPLAYEEVGGNISYEYAQTNINFQPKWEVFPGFNLKGQFNYRINTDVYRQKRDNYYFFDYYTEQLVQTWAVQRVANAQTRDVYYFLSGSADYTRNFDKHRFFGIGGYSMEQFNNGYTDVSSILSGYAKINYSYDDKYLIETSLRLDGSSKFGPDKKYGLFPSIALGWNISNEEFLKNSSVINNLKLRASYGQLGNENIGLYNYQSLINATNGLEISAGNPIFSWEKVNLLDIGADIGFFADNRLSVTFDYYNKITEDMILRPAVSLVSALGSPLINSGSVKNSGVEVAVNYNLNVNKDFNINIKPGFTYNKNKILDLKGVDGIDGINVYRNSIGSYWGYKTDGLLQAEDFNTDGTPKIPVMANAGPGDVKYLDLNQDGLITTDDQDVIGNQHPKLNYFANVSLSYKKFDLEFLVQGVGSHDYSANLAGKSSGYLWNPLNFDASGGVPTVWRAANTWTPVNTDASLPRLLANPGRNVQNSDFWLFNGAYTRMKFIQLGYRLSGNNPTLKKLKIQSARVYVNAQNPFLFTSLEQADPESGGGSWTYGVMKTYTIGVHVGF